MSSVTEKLKRHSCKDKVEGTKNKTHPLRIYPTLASRREFILFFVRTSPSNPAIPRLLLVYVLLSCLLSFCSVKQRGMAEVVSRIPRGEEVRSVVEEEDSSSLKAASTCKRHERGSRSLSLSCGNSQRIESTAQLRLLHKGASLHIWILGMAPK